MCKIELFIRFMVALVLPVLTYVMYLLIRLGIKERTHHRKNQLIDHLNQHMLVPEARHSITMELRAIDRELGVSPNRPQRSKVRYF